jgi:hypothetical protein
VTTDFGLSLFGATEQVARGAYRRFMAQASYASEDTVLEDVHGCDARILGTDGFLEGLRTAPFIARSRLTLEELADQVCQQFSLPPDAVRSASRQRSLTAARVEIAKRAVDERVACLAEVAAFLNREPGSLSELLRRHRRR